MTDNNQPADSVEVTQADIHAAALQWCSEKDRETFPEDVDYFKCQWWALPGLRARVEAAARHRLSAQPAREDVFLETVKAIEAALIEPDVAGAMAIVQQVLADHEALLSHPSQPAQAGDAISAIQEMIDSYSIAGANVLDWLTKEDREQMPPSASQADRDWGSNVACRATFSALRDAQAKIAALRAQPTHGTGNFLTAYVSQDGKDISIKHDLDADWDAVRHAHEALRDRLIERIAERDKCPFSPSQPAQAGNLWIERWNGSEPMRGSSIWTTDSIGCHQNLIEHFGGDEETHKSVSRIVSAHNNFHRSADPFRPMEEWDAYEDKDELVLLIVEFEGNSTDDAIFAITIGGNNDHNVGPDEGQGWQFAGWDWCQDCFTEGRGKPVRWAPLPHHIARAMDDAADAASKGGAA